MAPPKGSLKIFEALFSLHCLSEFLLFSGCLKQFPQGSLKITTMEHWRLADILSGQTSHALFNKLNKQLATHPHRPNPFSGCHKSPQGSLKKPNRLLSHQTVLLV